MWVNLKWIFLGFVSFVPFGLFWAYDIPGAIQNQITEWFGPENYDDAKNLNLYAVYSYPNVILGIIAGFITDKLTVRLASIIFCGFVFGGQIIFSLGVQFKIFWMCLVGRFIFGVGGESVFLASVTFIGRWFDGGTLAYAFGVAVACARSGSVLNFISMPFLVDAFGVPFSIWFATIICGISFSFTLIVSFLDKKGEKRGLVKESKRSSGGLMEVIYSFKEVVQFPLLLWLIVILNPMYYASLITFFAIGSKILQETGQYYSPTTASIYVSIPNFFGILGPPIWGKLIDKIGYSLWWGLLGGLLHIVGLFIFLAFSLNWIYVHPIITMSIIGLAYSIWVPSLWPMVPFIVHENKLGRAYGILTVAENIGYVVIPSIIGSVQTNPVISETIWQYVIPVNILLICATVSFFFSLITFFVDAKWNNGILNCPGYMKQYYKNDLNHVEEEAETVPDDEDDVPLILSNSK